MEVWKKVHEIGEQKWPNKSFEVFLADGSDGWIMFDGQSQGREHYVTYHAPRNVIEWYKWLLEDGTYVS